jgi:hypothetical protein
MRDPDLIMRIFYPGYIANQNRWAEKRWQLIAKQSKLSEEFRSSEALAMHLPDLTPLLVGSVQPADFVKQHASLPKKYVEEEYARAFTGLARRADDNAYYLQFYSRIMEYMSRRRELFRLAVAKEEIHLETESNLILKQHSSHILALVLLTLLALITLLILGVSPYSVAPFVLLDDLTYGSFLLIPITISLFIYSCLIRTHHEEQQAIDVKRTRLASTIHAYETYEDVHRIQRRLQVRSMEATNEAREIEDTRNDILLQREKLSQNLVQVRLESVVDALSSLKERIPEFKAFSERERLMILRSILEPIEQDTDEYERPNTDDFEDYP